MSLMKSSIPLTLYRLEPSTLANVTGDAIRRFAFRSIDNTPDEKVYGFVPEDDMFADLETLILEKGQYMSFGFRIDTGKIPSAILKKHLAEMTRAPPQRQGKTFLSSSQKKELKDLCKSRLFSKTEPRPSMNGVAIDTSNGLVYVAGTSKSTLELFENYAKTAFGGEMKRMSPSTLSASDSEHPLEDLMSNIYAESMTLSLNGKTYSIAEQGKATLSRTDGPSVSVTDAPNSAKSDWSPGSCLPASKSGFPQCRKMNWCPFLL